MDKTAIKNFAVWARKKLIEDIKQKAYEIGITEKEIKEPKVTTSDTMIIGDRTLNKAEMEQRKSLVLRIRDKGFNNVIEEVAYTWFNRFIALRFMEVNGYLPTGVRVLSAIEPGKKEPDIIKEALNTDLDLDRELVYRLQDANDTEGLYRYLLVKQCNALNEILPGLFEEIEDYTEILLPSNLLAEGSVIRQLIDNISEEDFKDQVEIIGWMYQYYISEKKDEVFEGLKKNIKITKENIPAATQLFTPDWIVKYMVENSLGRLWFEGHPDEELKSKWKYYLEEAEQEPEVQKQLEEIRAKSRDIRPEDIKVLDPAMGSGHILVYAFDVLYGIYKSAGYSERDIPKLILENNLYGLDIDDRAAQLAYFAVMMKARSKSRRIFREKVNLNICAIQESNGLVGSGKWVVDSEKAVDSGQWIVGSKKIVDGEQWIVGSRKLEEIVDYFVQGVAESEKVKLKADIEYLINVFYDAKEYGSILEVKPIDFDAIERRLEEIRKEEPQYIYEREYKSIILEKLPALVKQARIMSQKYDVVCTNPPYMSARASMSSKLTKYLGMYYPLSKNDLFTVFMDLGNNLTKPNGYNAMINQHSWMFLSGFAKFREKLYKKCCFINMLHLGAGVFEGIAGEVVQSVAFVIRKQPIRAYKGMFFKLLNKNWEDWLKNNDNLNKKNLFLVNLQNIQNIPNGIFCYWLGEKSIQKYYEGTRLDAFADPRVGLATGENDRFVRMWHEVSFDLIGFNVSDGKQTLEIACKWIPYNKGGQYRKWYGNREFVVDWYMNGKNITDYKQQRLLRGEIEKKNSECWNREYYFKESLSWSKVSSSHFAVRYYEAGFIFDVAGCSIFGLNDNIYYFAGLLNSSLKYSYIEALSPTLNFETNAIKAFPVVIPDDDTKKNIEKKVKQNIHLSKTDWDSFETSWDFKCHPLLLAARGQLEVVGNGGEDKNYPLPTIHYPLNTIIQQAFNNWAAFTEKQFNQLKANEEELNRIFIEIYGLQDELTPEVEDKDITIRKADRERDIKSFISYAVGCMFGRYSIDAEGLIYAGGDFKDKWKCENGQWKVRKIVKDEEGKVVEDTWVDAAFAPDMDNILPITDDEYFEDDIVSRFVQFLKVTFGEDTLEENLDYIADTLGKKSSETARQAIRRYFLKEFYKDHVQVYQKKPIYWLFDSGKQDGFKALIYIHRYDEFTVARVRTDYLHKLQKSYEAEIKRLDIVIDSNASQREKTNSRKKKEKILKQIDECLQYDQVIAHVANQRIKIDLDDGVSINYAKFQGIEIPQGEGRKPLKADLLVKI